MSNTKKLSRLNLAVYQAALDRLHFSTGFIDGDPGFRTERAVRAFQASRGLPINGKFDEATCLNLEAPEPAFIEYVFTDKDFSRIVPTPKTWIEKSKAAYLGYNNEWEMAGELFHSTPGFLKSLNPGVANFSAGSSLRVPNISPPVPLPKPASVRVILSEQTIQTLDESGTILTHFPCSIAANKDKRPSGTLTVKVVAPETNYTYDPALFPEVTEDIKGKLIIPPGPNGPVGTCWVGLSLPGYGIHGTPNPEDISRTQSHGCFRLANWNAEKMVRMVKTGMPVEVLP